MRLGQAALYGILGTLHIAAHEKNGPVKGREIAKECGIPVEYLHNILLRLSRVHILRSERGRLGGFTLGKPPGKTTLLEIIEAIDGRLDTALLLRGRSQIPASGRLKYEAVRDDILARTRAKFSNVTIKQLMG